MASSARFCSSVTHDKLITLSGTVQKVTAAVLHSSSSVSHVTDSLENLLQPFFISLSFPSFLSFFSFLFKLWPRWADFITRAVSVKPTRCWVSQQSWVGRRSRLKRRFKSIHCFLSPQFDLDFLNPIPFKKHQKYKGRGFFFSVFIITPNSSGTFAVWMNRKCKTSEMHAKPPCFKGLGVYFLKNTPRFGCSRG